MKPNFLKLLVVFAVLGMVAFSSCTKDNSVTIIETEEELQTQFMMMINGREVQTNAIATYCQNDTMEVLAIANKNELLGFPLFPTEFDTFEAGDFSFVSLIHEGISFDIATVAYGEDITGFPGLSIMISEAQINIESNNGEIVVGSSEGSFLLFDENNIEVIDELPYTINFVAEIIESNICE